MYAVIRTGGKQYKVAENDVIAVERLEGETGSEVTLSDVLAVHDGTAVRVGAPTIEGAVVTANVLDQSRADKIIVFKKKRRQNYRRKAGHRQLETVLRITSILPDGQQKKAASSAKAEAKAEPAAKPAENAAVEQAENAENKE